MKLDHTASSSDEINSSLATSGVQFLPSKVADVPKDLLRNFPHTKRVGNYLLGRTLGEGSFAKVKEGLHTLTGEKVAIKVIDKKKAKEDVYVRKNLRREGKLLQMVRHKHVVQLFEIMETENSYYLVTELCQGGDLMDHICNKKRLEEKETKKYIRQIISAVDYLHKAGVLHRDLKVENLLLDASRDIKIIDFGLSNSVRVSHTKEGGSTIEEFCVTQCGSPAYAAPELLGNKKYGPKVDIWSIGVNMYAMLTGNLPFTVEPFNIKALHNKMLKGEMNPIPDHLSRNCKELLKKFLNPDVDQRITLQEAMQHSWITDGRNRSIDSVPFPNKLSSDDLDHNIIKHMAHNMEFRLSDVIRLVTNNLPNSSTATYHLLNKKLAKYNGEMRNKTKVATSKLVSDSNSSSQPSTLSLMQGNTDTGIDLLPLNSKPKKVKSTQPNTPGKNTQTADKENKIQEEEPEPKDTPSTKESSKTNKPKPENNPTSQATTLDNNPKDPDSLEDLKLDLNPSGQSSTENEPKKRKVEKKSREEDIEEEVEEVKFFQLPGDQGTPRRPDTLSPIKHHYNETPREVHPPFFSRPSPIKPSPGPVDLPAIVSKPTEKSTNQSEVSRRHSENGHHFSETNRTNNNGRNIDPPPSMEEVKCNTLQNRPKTFSHTVQMPPSHQEYVSQRNGVENSSQSTTSSNGHRSTCSNPSNTKTFSNGAGAVDDKGCISDPSTRKERKSAFTRPAAKKVVIDVGHYDRFARDRNGNILPPGTNSPPTKTFPAVTQSPDHNRTVAHNRRFNLVYPTYASNKAKPSNPNGTPRQGVLPIRNIRTSYNNNKEAVLNVTGEKAGIGNGRLTSMARNSNDVAPFTPRFFGVHHEDDQVMDIQLGGERSCDKGEGGVGGQVNSREHKVALPLLSPPTTGQRNQYL